MKRAAFDRSFLWLNFCFTHKPCRGAAQFLQAEMRRPFSRLPVQFYVIRTTFGIFFQNTVRHNISHMARLHKFMNNQTLPLRAGCRGRQPLHLDIFRYKVVKPTGEHCSPLQIMPMVCCAAKSLRSLRILLWIRI